MNGLTKGVQDYVTLRRALGYKITEYPKMLNDFVVFLQERKAPFITSALALEWARLPDHLKPARSARRLRVVRQFATHWKATDPRTEIPAVDLLPDHCRRATPHIYTRQEIRRLVDAAQRLPSKTGMRAATYSVVYGFMAVTGLRVSEVLGLNREDIELAQGVLTVRKSMS